MRFDITTASWQPDPPLIPEVLGAGELAPAEPQPRPPADAMAAAAQLAALAKAPNTVKAYTRQWGQFADWCQRHRLAALPAEPESIGAYLAERAASGWSYSTLTLTVAAISSAHRVTGCADPIGGHVRGVLAGLRRTLGVAPTRQAKALLPEDLRAGLPALRTDRQRAAVLIGWCAALRVSELIALTCADLELREDGLVLTIRRSKTDQDGAGRKVGIPLSSLTPIWEYLMQRSSDSEQLWDPPLNEWDVSRWVRTVAKAAGREPNGYSSHSLRAGYVTAAARKGLPLQDIQRQTGHRSLEVLTGYIRNSQLIGEALV